MAEVDAAPSFGAELKDSFKPVNGWVSNGINWLEDIHQFYRERSAIEREYSAKLSALAKKYHEKKARKISSLSVGDTPTLTPGSLESASLTTWTTQLSTLEKRAAEHERYATELISNIADPLKFKAGRFEDLRKIHVEYNTKLDKEKETSIATLKKAKGHYDGTCQEVESKRKKVDSAFDSSKAKAQSSFNHQVSEMNNAKNSYIIHINIVNQQKGQYYHHYLSDLLDSMQDISETRTSELNKLWSLAASLEGDMLTRSGGYMQSLGTEITRNEPKLDSLMFIRHNTANWQEPPDLAFEPCPVWHDDSSIATDENAKVYLRNILGKAKTQKAELKREADTKRREVEKVQRQRKSAREGRDKGDETELIRTHFVLHEALHQSELKLLAAETEVSTITGIVGDLSIGARNHNFKGQTFKIPTNCDLCGDRIWGLSAKGFDCQDCGYTCHSKCQLKVPPDCPGEQSKEGKKKLKTERQAAANAVPAANGAHDGTAELPGLDKSNTMNSLSSGYATSAHRSVSSGGPKPGPAELSGDAPAAPAPVRPPVGGRRKMAAPPPTAYVEDAGRDSTDSAPAKHSDHKGKMVYAYQANGEGELTVDEGTEVTIVDADDGSGWMTIKALGETGVVPASYVESLPAAAIMPERPTSAYSNSSASAAGSVTAGKKKGPAVAPKRGAKKLQAVEALYDYSAQTDAEFSMSEGDRFVFVKDTGDGWAEVEKGGQVKSVPANYIQHV